mmetsp:Transcript_145751/g.363447  ORF Transcript_145751/g.363447 Transcript_145751/m.363447 type:complete len:281 (+) Transcript_145751:448-1290(+)
MRSLPRARKERGLPTKATTPKTARRPLRALRRGTASRRCIQMASGTRPRLRRTTAMALLKLPGPTSRTMVMLQTTSRSWTSCKEKVVMLGHPSQQNNRLLWRTMLLQPARTLMWGTMSRRSTQMGSGTRPSFMTSTAMALSQLLGLTSTTMRTLQTTSRNGTNCKRKRSGRRLVLMLGSQMRIGTRRKRVKSEAGRYKKLRARMPTRRGMAMMPTRRGKTMMPTRLGTAMTTRKVTGPTKISFRICQIRKSGSKRRNRCNSGNGLWRTLGRPGNPTPTRQ